MQKDHQALSSVLDDLRSKGYTHHFFKKNNFIHCMDPELNFHTHELEIEEVYRQHDRENAAAGSVLYTIVSNAMGIKGVLLNNY